MLKKQTYGLEEALLEYALRIIKTLEQTPKAGTGNGVDDQFLRSKTSSDPNHGRAQATDSPRPLSKGFVLKICFFIRCSTYIFSTYKPTPYGEAVTRP